MPLTPDDLIETAKLYIDGGWGIDLTEFVAGATFGGGTADIFFQRIGHPRCIRVTMHYNTKTGQITDLLGLLDK
jgi:hypothetical protein